MSAMTDYKAGLNQRYWEYQKKFFPEWEDIFERPQADNGRPPVFLRSEAGQNVLIDPSASQNDKERLFSIVPEGDRHKWFGSMNSSQALAQSVFGNLAIYGLLDRLAAVEDDEGMLLFGNAQVTAENFKMEHKIDYLGERRQTSLDGYFSGDYRVAIECKFTEAEVGTCSRPRMPTNSPNYESEFCDGTYSRQKNRTERCSLTEIGVTYWNYVPALFRFQNDAYLAPCPLNKNYQLVRNILAIGVKNDKTVSIGNGHAVLIYDERNPAFREKGDGLLAYTETRLNLLEPNMLRKCSWQKIVKQIRHDGILPWLTERLDLKYGL